MDVLVNLGIYIAICAGILGIVWGGIWLKQKYNIKSDEINLATTIINLIIYLADKSGVKYAGDIKKVAYYVLVAIGIIEKFEKINNLEEKKELVFKESLTLCEKNGIILDSEIIALVNEIVDYFVK